VQWGDNGMLVSNTDSNTPRIINTSDGNFLVSWLVSNGIIVQKIDINGVGWWTVGGVQVFNQAVGNDYQMVEDGDGIIFVWSSGGNIYAQKLFNNGTLDASSPLAVSVNALTNGTFGQPYQYRIAATGGNGNRYQWQITSGRLPSGLDFDVATGIVSGTPQETGAFYFSVSVTDGATVIEKDLQMFIQIETGLETEWNDQPQVAKGSSYLVVTRKSNKLWGCFLNDNGEVIGSKFLIYSAGWIPRQPEVVYNPVNQKYLVVFSADSKLRGVFIDGATREVGQEFIIVDANYWFPAAAVNTQSGSYLVMACEYVYGGAWKGIILDKDGNTVVPLFQIGQYSEYGYSGAVAYNPDSDNFLAVYSYRQKNMKGRTVENDGSLGTEQTVATSPNSNGLDCPSLIYNSTTGKYLLGYSIINSYRVRANYLNGDGTVSSSAFYVSRTSLQEGDIIDVAVAKDGTEWAFWHDYADSQGQQTYGNSYIYAQKITAEGPAFESDLLITNYAGFKQKPAVVPGNANNNFLVFWNQDYSKVYGTFWKIPAQRGDLNEDGSLDIADLVICVRVVLGFDEPDLLLGDINRDGVVDIFDVILLLKEILNLN
ncbi:MAG TPA: putative Ig domain-containing protein, partial [bacterium]|nr:putative Ig domain-containing protein [bacterium]